MKETRLLTLVALSLVMSGVALATAFAADPGVSGKDVDRATEQFALRTVREGRVTFRHNSFGSEAFWGDTLQLHRALAGQALGGVGPGVSPRTALSLGLKVDADALPDALVQQLKEGKVNWTTLPPPWPC